ncbi:hypothetical protein Q3A66_19305 [Hymenobacter sp. BT770]|uniref:hypothetical protein n=1 Tax=Hymenobacter sp. BT770 TaxID=2886942 RepID=UPI001D1157C3|nr:hypothetical protein [Hymenobacter sp. BT770]MCC3155174.1 hypothetical protein [Hymenobacter sp. BT770]MDO3417222.1 hypothetical protein [Hymenobacter sp. BT770]
MKTKISSFVLFIIALLSYGKVLAQNPHEMKPTTVVDNGLTLTVSYDIAGLGNVSSTTGTLNYDVLVKTQCRNPGGNIAPGQDFEYTSVDQTFPVRVDKNGRAKGSYTTPAPTVDLSQADCPNGKWRPEIADAIYSKVTFTLAGKTFYTGTPTNVVP